MSGKTSSYYLPFRGRHWWLAIGQEAVGIVNVNKLIHYMFQHKNCPTQPPGVIAEKNQFTSREQFDLT